MQFTAFHDYEKAFKDFATTAYFLTMAQDPATTSVPSSSTGNLLAAVSAALVLTEAALAKTRAERAAALNAATGAPVAAAAAA